MWRYSKDTDEEEEVSKDSLQERTLRAAKATRRAVAEKAERLCYQAVRVCVCVYRSHTPLEHDPHSKHTNERPGERE